MRSAPPQRTVDAALDRAARALRRHRYVLPAAAAVLLVFAWMVTYGTWDLFDKESFAEFYDGQARSLLSGRLDVPREYILDEAFLRDGKAYGYFGFAPALLHVPLVLLWPDSAGRWARLSEIAACCLSLWYAYKLLLRARAAFGLPLELDRRSKVLYSAFLIVLGLGSTLLFMSSRSYVFHEAIIWGAAFALGCYDHLCAYLAAGRFRSLVAACLFAFLAFFSRGSVGVGTLVALLLTDAAVVARARRRSEGGAKASHDWRPPLRHAGAITSALGLTVAAFVGINYARFRTYFDAAPLRLYAQMQANPERLRRTGGKLMSLANVRTAAVAYLSPANIRLGPHFPWVYATRSAHVFPEARYDLIEPYAGLTATTPALVVLAAAGAAGGPLVLRRRGRRAMWPLIPMAGALAGGATAFAADALSYRYLHDFFPFLAVAGAFGLHVLFFASGRHCHPERSVGSLPSLERKRSFAALRMTEAGASVAENGASVAIGNLLLSARRVGIAVLLTVAAFGIWANFSIALVYQRTIVGGVAGERQKNFKTWQDAIDRHVSSRLFGP